MIGWLSAAALAADLTWYAIPNAAVDTDDGFGAGGRVELAWLEEGLLPYKSSLVVQGYAAASGYQHHRLRFDRVGLGSRHRTRVTTHVAWRQWLNDGYWGIGNGTTRERAFVGTFGRDDPDRRRYRYRLFQPFAHVTVRHALADDGPLELFAALSPKWSWIETYEGSLLEEDAPYGLAGGPTLQGYLGVLHDTRTPEIAPISGHLLELSGRFAPDLGGEAGGFGGGLASARLYGALGPGVVLAFRGLGEWLWGSVPFYEMVHWGGAIPIAGVGGPEILRGASFGRWRAPGKAVAQTELRLALAELRVLDAPMALELAPYVDLGVVWGAGAPSPPPIPVHPAVGGGVRLIYDATFVGRIDSGVALDPVTEPDGSVSQVPVWGLYLTFDHPF